MSIETYAACVHVVQVITCNLAILYKIYDISVIFLVISYKNKPKSRSYGIFLNAYIYFEHVLITLYSSYPKPHCNLASGVAQKVLYPRIL